MQLTFREATADDATVVSQLHADSWRRNYRGIFSDDYLDNQVANDRDGIWADRLVHNPDPRRFVLLAQDESALAGFICIYAEEDPRLGSLIDNLHVAAAHQRHGVGRMLMRNGAMWLREHYPRVSVFLYVLTGNARAIQFYEALRGRREGPVEATSADGSLVSSYIYAWDTPDALIGAANVR